MENNGNRSPVNAVKNERRSRSRSPLDKGGKDRHSNNRDSRDRRGGRVGKSNLDNKDDRRRNRAPSTKRVYVANISFECKWTDVKDLFREKVGDVAFVELFEDVDGKFRGCGIVEFKDQDSVPKAIEVLHRAEYKGRNLVVKEDFDVDRDKTGRPITNRSSRNDDRRGGGDMDRGRGGNDKFMPPVNPPQFNTFGLNPQFLQSLGINGPLTNKIFVANLDYKVTVQKLKDIFKLAGRVTNVELKTDEEGNSKGHGTVEFEHPIEAVQAISMFGGQKLFNRTMSVRMDRFSEEKEAPSKLPAGLSGVGKGLGAGGQALNVNNANNPVPNVGSGMPSLGVGGSGNSGLGGVSGLMGNSGLGNMGGLSNVNSGLGGMGLGGVSDNFQRNMLGTGMGGSNLSGLGSLGSSGLGNSGLGLGSGSSGLGLGSQGLGLGMGNSNLMGNSFGSSLGGGGGGTGSNMLGSSLNSSSGFGLAGSSPGGLGGGSLNDYDRNFDRSDTHRSPRLSDTIIVRNFPNSYTWQTLRDRFRDVGDVRHTEIKGRGVALIRFSTERDAQRAVDLMHGIRIDGRPIDVNFY